MDITSLNALSASPAAIGWPTPPTAATVQEHSRSDEQGGINASDSAQANEEEASSETAIGPTRPDGTPLTPEESQHLEQLKQTDRAVRQHEMAHQIAGGPYTGGASYEYEVGPDGKRYAVAGEVPIDYGPIPGDPHATIEKMQTVIAAALAPTDPSPKDLQVAAQARQYLLEAKLEAAREQSEMSQARSSLTTTGESGQAA